MPSVVLFFSTYSFKEERIIEKHFFLFYLPHTKSFLREAMCTKVFTIYIVGNAFDFFH